MHTYVLMLNFVDKDGGMIYSAFEIEALDPEEAKLKTIDKLEKMGNRDIRISSVDMIK